MTEMGRPTYYKEEFDDLAYKFALLGATDEQLADVLNICVATLNTWKSKYPNFLASIKRGKDQADAEIAHALYHRAKGFKCKKQHVSNYRGEVTVTEVDEQYPPDTAASFIWLKNRQSAKWRDRKEVDVDIENADEYFKTIADAIAQSDTDPN